ncbi:ABC transporter substrate-binding protein [Ruicaihuangia caeni]|uniref:Thiamine pyrimidine synthase n=1 Tax=Ruicaihuangia caeni TaxID=3042517 RepID=A0AAW6TAP3_9MICO|nr:ABC transporter substrate-binding protein [Klugiella sp. YN-L-19]MDI2099130.1 ABC transporter substrate-binding protein [Klugiella sp. YN-L-19]
MKASLAPLRRLGTGAAALLAAGLLLAGCSTTAPAAPEETPGDQTDQDFGELSIQLSWVKIVEFAGEYFADDRGYFEDAGFSSVNLIAGPAPTAAIVASGQAMVGISDPTRIAPAIANEGAPVKIIANQYQKSPFTIMSLADKANITKPEDLIGKRIGIQTGNEPLFYALLDANDIDHDDVTIVPVEYDPSPLTTGDVDGFLAYVTNEAVILESQGYDVANLLYADNGLPVVAKSIVVSQDSIDNNRDALKAFLYASILGWKDSIADPDESARLSTDVYGADLNLDYDLEREQAAVAARDLLTSGEAKELGLFNMSEKRMNDVVKLINDIGVSITADELFDMSLLNEVYQEHPELLD